MTTTPQPYRILLQFLLVLGLLMMAMNVQAQMAANLKPWFTEQDLTYENPGCKNAWPLAKLDRWLKTHTSWIPFFNEPPYREVPGRPWTGRVTREDYEQVERPNLLDGVGKGGIDVFTSTDMEKVVRKNQIMWLDIDGDGKCDFIGWDYSYTGMSARGEQGNTTYYIFLQKNDGFKLIDYTEIGFERWGNGQKPDAILPVWIKGEKRPFLVARSNLRFISGETIGIYASGRTALRWNATKNFWDEIGTPETIELERIITEFVKSNPSKSPSSPPCISTPVACDAPR